MRIQRLVLAPPDDPDSWHLTNRRTTSPTTLSFDLPPAFSSSSVQTGSGTPWTSQPHPARGIARVQNRSTISKDKVQGDEQSMADLLAHHGNKVMRSQHITLDMTHFTINPSVNTLQADTCGKAPKNPDGDEARSVHLVDVAEGTESDDSERSEYPKRGKTRIPEYLVNEEALHYLGYDDYTRNGKVIVINLALGQKLIDELLQTTRAFNKGELKPNRRR